VLLISDGTRITSFDVETRTTTALLVLPQNYFAGLCDATLTEDGSALYVVVCKGEGTDAVTIASAIYRIPLQ
jgi:hypothetical protein